MKVVEKPNTLSVDICPVGMEDYQGPLQGLYLGRRSPVRFTVRVQSAAPLPIGDYRIRVNCRFAADSTSPNTFFGRMTIFLHVIDPSLRVTVLEQGTPVGSPDQFPGLIADFEERRYIDGKRKR